MVLEAPFFKKSYLITKEQDSAPIALSYKHFNFVNLRELYTKNTFVKDHSRQNMPGSNQGQEVI